MSMSETKLFGTVVQFPGSYELRDCVTHNCGGNGIQMPARSIVFTNCEKWINPDLTDEELKELEEFEAGVS